MGQSASEVGVDELVGSVDGYATLMEAIKQASPVPISIEQIASGAKGYFHVEENRIAIQEGMSEGQTVLEAISAPCCYMETVIEGTCAGKLFKAKGKQVIELGWKTVAPLQSDGKDDIENISLEIFFFRE